MEIQTDWEVDVDLRKVASCGRWEIQSRDENVLK